MSSPTAAARTLAFSSMSDVDISKTLKEHSIGLTVDEAKTIQKLLGRDPTLTEAIIWGIQGSEHSSYKSSRRFLKGFLTKGTHIILGPSEDSGIVAITDSPAGKRWGLVVTHESHNHPSQIVPFEGAATGVGGTVRDVVCMGARVIGCMDMLRLGDLKTEESRSIAKEVMRGIAGYGNPLGIPNLGGDTVFDSSYNSNCLVNAIALGIVREDEVIHSYVPDEAGEVGYDIILIGKPTDRSGFGGAAFASVAMDEEKREQNTGAVQEPNPFLERHILASTYALFDWLAASSNLHKVSFKDLGAGGIVCATVEQVADRGMGARIALEKAHTALKGLPPEVIACAETQERLCWMCHPSLTEQILKHYNELWDLPTVAENARASVIGKVTKESRYIVTYNGEVICDAEATAITSGLQYTRPTAKSSVSKKEPDITCDDNKVRVAGKSFTLTEIFESMLAHPNHASKAAAIRHYDKNVIGNTIVEAGEADAGVIAPLRDLPSYVHDGKHPGWELNEKDRYVGVAVAADGNGRYGRISAYAQGLNAALESMRNVVAVGATPRALTDCLNYGNPEIPEQLGALEEGVRGIAEASKGIAFDGEPVPVISGNVSLYNGKPDGTAIDPTAIVSCAGIMPDARKAVTMQLKTKNSTLILLGERKDECGGSAYYQVLEELTGSKRDTFLGSNVPLPDLKEQQALMQFVLEQIRDEKVLSCHDISDGGLLLSLFEMTLPQRKMGGDVGIVVDLDQLSENLRSDIKLFSETPGFIIEVDAAQADILMETAQKLGVTATIIGSTTAEGEFVVKSGNKAVIQKPLKEFHARWKDGLTQTLSRS